MAIATIIIFFALQFPTPGGKAIGEDTLGAWWGNTVFLDTVDYAGAPLLPLPDKGYFGPDSW